MNKIIKALPIVLFAVIIGCLFVESKKKAEAEELIELDMQIPNEIYEQMRLEENAVAASQKIWNSFSVRSDGMWIYPDDFGGMYIDGQYLCIYVKNLREENRQYYLSLIDDLDGYVNFFDAEYSRNELQEIANEINEEVLKQGFILYSIGVDDIHQGIHIYTSQELFEEVKTVAALIAPDIPVIIEIITAPVPTTTFLYGGDAIKIHN